MITPSTPNGPIKLSINECKTLSFDDYNTQMIQYAGIQDKKTLKFINKHTNKKNQQNTIDIQLLDGYDHEPFFSGNDLIEIYGKENVNKLKKPNSLRGHYAAEKGNVAGLQFFLTINGNPNIKNQNGRTLLHHIVCNKDEIVYNRNYDPNYTQKNNAAIQLLITQPKIDIIAQDNEGNTAIHYAANFKLIDHFLAIKNIELNIKNKQGETPFFYSLHHRGVSTEGDWTPDTIIYNDYQFERLCDDLRTKINTQNNNGETPLHYLINNPRITEKPNRAGHHEIYLPPTLSYDNKQTQRLLKRIDIDPNKHDNNKETPLHYAVKINSKTRDYKGEYEFNKDYYKKSILGLGDQIYLNNIKLLLDGHADTLINPQNIHGETPLICAVKANNRAAVELLLSYRDDSLPAHKKINADVIDNAGKTALDHAIDLDNKDIITLLQPHTTIQPRPRSTESTKKQSLHNNETTVQKSSIKTSSSNKENNEESSFFYKYKKPIIAFSLMGLMGILASIMTYLHYR